MNTIYKNSNSKYIVAEFNKFTNSYRAYFTENELKNRGGCNSLGANNIEAFTELLYDNYSSAYSRLKRLTK